MAVLVVLLNFFDSGFSGLFNGSIDDTFVSLIGKMKVTNILFAGSYDAHNNELLAFVNSTNHLRIAGIFENPANAISSYSSLKPEIVFIDAYQEGFNGFEVARFITEQEPSIKIIIVSEDYSFDFLSLALEMRLYGYFPKNLKESLIADLFDSILVGRPCFPYLHHK